MPVEVHVKRHPAWFHRFDVSWTPTILVLDPEGVERYRIEGYLPTAEFRAQLELGLGRVAFQRKKWSDAAQMYGDILEHYPDTTAAPEAVYWAGVSRYQGSHDPAILGQTAQTLKQKYPHSTWATKASVWGS